MGKELYKVIYLKNDKKFILTIVFILTVFILINIIFYNNYQGSYISFLFGQIILFILFFIYNFIIKIKSKVEVTRLKSVEELKKYYKIKALMPSPFKIAYQYILNKTLINDDVWIPGIIEKIFFSNKNIYLEPVDQTDWSWANILDKLIKPNEDSYALSFKTIGWNELKIRPLKIKDEDDNVVIYVQPTTYYYSFITNFSCDLKIKGMRDITLREILEPLLISQNPDRPLRSIEELKNVPISNHLGIGIIIITKDGYILLQRRSSNVAVEQNVVGPTIAGSLDWKTLAYFSNGNNKINIIDLVQQEISESEELSYPKISDYTLYPVAIARNLRHLGKPDIYLIGFLNKNVRDVLVETQTGSEVEIREILLYKISNNTLDSNLISKCQLAKLISEYLYIPLIHHKKELIFTSIKNKGKYHKKTKIKYNDLSSSLMIGLFAIYKLYKEHCK